MSRFRLCTCMKTQLMTVIVYLSQSDQCWEKKTDSIRFNYFPDSFRYYFWIQCKWGRSSVLEGRWLFFNVVNSEEGCFVFCFEQAAQMRDPSQGIGAIPPEGSLWSLDDPSRRIEMIPLSKNVCAAIWTLGAIPLEVGACSTIFQ